MTSKLSLSSSISSATLVAINSISASTVAADDKQNHHAAVVAAVAADNPLKDVSVEQDEITSALDNAERDDRLFTPKSSTAVMKPDVGILNKEFSMKGREQPVVKQFAIHRKKQAVAADVDVGILGNGRWRVGQWQHQKKAFDTNLHENNEVVRRSLQSEYEFSYIYMCPTKNGRNGLGYIDNLFNKTDSYFHKCSCPSPTTCGPNLCECLELDADGDILQCMDPLKQLCEGTNFIEGIPGPWSMEECLGDKQSAIYYCSMLPCFVDGGSFYECQCNLFDSMCTEYRDFQQMCAASKCCQAQTDDEGREACINGGFENYIEEDTSFSLSPQEMASRFKECAFNSEGDKSIVQCYCDSFSYGLCVNYGVAYPDTCEAMNCCWEQTEDDARLDCFSRFRNEVTGNGFYWRHEELQESCVASGRSSDKCKCDIHGLSYCVNGILNSYDYSYEPRCDLFQCCQSQTSDDDDLGRKDCLLQDEIQFGYVECLMSTLYFYSGSSTESCICDKSSKLCASGNSNDLHCVAAVENKQMIQAVWNV
jgi:hypothetical protein